MNMNLIDSRCMTNPKTVAHNNTHNSLYFAAAPDWRSDSIFPGSKYAIDLEDIIN